MERRSPLRAMSQKRRAALAEQGNRNPFSTLTNGGAVGRGSVPRPAAPAPKRRPRDTGPDAATVALVWERDTGRCVRCGGVLTGTRGLDWSVQHRRARQGTDRRPDTNQPANLILLCGSATTLCHGHVESFRAEARLFGWAIRQTEDPAVMPVRHALHGWALLANDGTFTAFSPNHTEGAPT
jgi:hypothetical protein